MRPVICLAHTFLAEAVEVVSTLVSAAQREDKATSEAAAADSSIHYIAVMFIITTELQQRQAASICSCV